MKKRIRSKNAQGEQSWYFSINNDNNDNILTTNYMPGSLLCALHDLFYSFSNLYRSIHSYFPNCYKETEVQRVEETSLGSELRHKLLTIISYSKEMDPLSSLSAVKQNV